MKTSIDFECVVIGAGIIGLAIAKSLSNKGFEVLLIEKNKSFGQETSSRNSGVIHAGIYYENNSIKSQLCLQGNKLLYNYANSRKINFKKCGKLIIAKNINEESKLLKIKSKAQRNGVELIYKNQKEAQKIEPRLNCYSALLSESSGIIDSYELMWNFLIDIESNGGKLIFNSEVESINPRNDRIDFFIDDNNKYSTKLLINSAGLQSHILASKIKDFNKSYIPQVKYNKGSYLKLVGKPPFKKLIYPLPTQNGLGIHSTTNLQNQTIFGPDDEQVKTINYDFKNSTHKKFENSIKDFWPEIIDREIQFDYSGIRTKVPGNDFIIQDHNHHGIPGIINLFGIESPGLTSSLAIGEFVTTKAKRFFNKVK